MSVFQCESCGCAENTALTSQGHRGLTDDLYDWAGKEDLRGKLLCSACSPDKFRSGELDDEGGRWHGQFDRVFLPLGEWETNAKGNLQHKVTKVSNYRDFATSIERFS